MIFVDSNIPMYLIGAAHPHKTDAQIILERLIAAGDRLVTDAEVLQEILHRYTAIDRKNAIAPALRVTLDIVDVVIPIEKADVLRAAEITQRLSARDALHIAIMERHGIRSILSFDADFDRWPGLQRIHRV
ncbi:MAG TPA: type II toxin-antitoxin system VapC family toxin [Bryobacteraceae bacterium]|nr:type II toxin-antitoxin system VapC family toxin [Bryobacteraceae bacterium]